MKDFDEFQRLLGSDGTNAEFQELKRAYAETHSQMESIANTEYLRTLLALRKYHEWVNS